MLLIQFGDRYLSKWKKIRKGLQHKDSNHIAANSLGFAGDTVIWRRNTLGKKHIWKKKIQCILGGRVHCWLHQHGDLDTGCGNPKWLNEENCMSQRKSNFLFH